MPQLVLMPGASRFESILALDFANDCLCPVDSWFGEQLAATISLAARYISPRHCYSQIDNVSYGLTSLVCLYTYPNHVSSFSAHCQVWTYTASVSTRLFHI